MHQSFQEGCSISGLLQFYRVEVKVLPPEADAAPRTRSVLRRFSHFTKLHARVSACVSYQQWCQVHCCSGCTPAMALALASFLRFALMGSGVELFSQLRLHAAQGGAWEQEDGQVRATIKKPASGR